MRKNYSILILTFFVISTFSLFLVKADGGIIAKPIVLKSIFETHQIATIRLDSERKIAEVSLFISLTDLSSEPNDIKFFIPFKDKPLSFNLADTTLEEFSRIEGINVIEQEIARQKRLKNEIRERYLSSLILPTILISPLSSTYFFISPLSAGLKPSEVLQFGTSHVEIYQVTSEGDLNSLIRDVGLPENIANKYREYGDMYIYLISMKTLPLIAKTTNLQKSCPKVYEEVIDYIRRHKEIKIYIGEAIPLEAYMFIELCPQAKDDIINIFKEVFTLEKGKIKGIKLTWKLNLVQKPEGYYAWYPLGTGKLWDNPIGLTEIYIFSGKFKNVKLSYPSVKLPIDEDVYIVRLENANPSNDLEIYASSELSLIDKISFSLSRGIKRFAFNLLTLLDSWIMWVIVLLTFVVSWILGFKLFSLYGLKKDLDLSSLIKESLLSLGIFIGSSWVTAILTIVLTVILTIASGTPLFSRATWILTILLPSIGTLSLFTLYNKSKYKKTWERGFILSLILLIKCLVIFGVLYIMGYLLILGISEIAI